MISYSANCMGPYGLWWYVENGLTNRTTRVLEKDIPLCNKKAGELVEYDEITEYWYGGRIDIYGTDDPYGAELGLSIMDGASWRDFSKWLSTFKTETMWELDQLVEEYEKTHPKIRWWKEK